MYVNMQTAHAFSHLIYICFPLIVRLSYLSVAYNVYLYAYCIIDVLTVRPFSNRNGVTDGAALRRIDKTTY